MDEILIDEIASQDAAMEEIVCSEGQTEENVIIEEQCEKQNKLDEDEPVAGVKKGRYDHIKFNRKVGVYIKVNSQGFITDVGSDVFIENLEGWQKIDEGEGDKYVFAQTQYFGTLVDEKGNYKFKKQ